MRFPILIILMCFASIALADEQIDLTTLRENTMQQISIDLETLPADVEGRDAEYLRDLMRNKRITAYYAQMYLSNPTQFEWAGLAAYVSDEVGVQIEIFQNGLALVFRDEYQVIVDANLAVYEDIYWQHLAYHQYGLPALEQAYEEELINENILQAWQFIDAGNTTEGITLIAEFEQGVVLQDALYDPLYEFFANTFGNVVIDSPVPDQDAPFTEANIADFETRWEWTVNDLLPGWSQFQADDPARVREDLLTFMLNADQEDMKLAAIDLFCADDGESCIEPILENCMDDMTLACFIEQHEAG